MLRDGHGLRITPKTGEVLRGVRGGDVQDHCPREKGLFMSKAIGADPFARFLDDAGPDLPECVINLIDALKHYRPWIKEMAEGVPDYAGGGWEVEPIEGAKDDLKKIDAFIEDLEKWGGDLEHAIR